MNEKVKEFIDKMKDVEKEEKGELLISLGLAEHATVRKYSENKDFIYDKFDNEKRLYYTDVETLVPIEITDDEYREILKYVPMFKNRVGNKNIKDGESSVSENIRVVAKIITGIYVIAGLIMLCNLDEDLMWIPISVIISGTVCYPFMVGFAKIVAAAEKILKGE